MMGKGEGRVKACTECRQQKLRCDAHEDYSRPCSRCSKMDLECKIQSSFKRVKKQTKAEMQREIDRLRRQTELPPSAKSSCPGIRPPSLAAENWDLQTPATITSQSTSHSTRASNASVPSVGASTTSIQSSDAQTLSRSLDGLEVDPKKIDDCFNLFFEHYTPLIPIVDSGLDPNLCYSQSPFLFWTILSIGSRRYTYDPTLLGWLAPRINTLALSSLSSRTAPIQKIQGLLLLCSWSVPINTMSKDITNVLSGAALHLALQIGLHVLGVGQDFARTTLVPDEQEKVLRARLWLQCLKACQSTSFCEGLPPPMVIDSGETERNRDEMIALMPANLQYRQRVHKIQTAAVISMMRNGLTGTSPTQASVINSLVKVFDTQLTDLTPESPSSSDDLYLNCARVQVQAFYFFAKSDCLDVIGLTELYSNAQGLIGEAMALSESQHLALYCSTYICRIIMLAAFSILKISRSNLRPFLDLKSGERAYFAAIRFLKSASLENDDLSARAATILSQLWISNRVFKKTDGSVDSLTIRIRSRSSMSVVFDCIWWWREEFGGQPNPFSDQRTPAKEHDIIFPEPSPTFQEPEYPMSAGYESPLPDFSSVTYIPDYDWVASLTFPTGNLGLQPFSSL